MTKVISPRGEEVDLENMMSEIGDGWKPIVRQLVEDLYAFGWEGRVSQIKEKFGGLRFYADGVPASGDDLIDKAEGWSELTCEQCGNAGELRTDGWLVTLCDECHDAKS